LNQLLENKGHNSRNNSGVAVALYKIPETNNLLMMNRLPYYTSEQYSATGQLRYSLLRCSLCVADADILHRVS